MKWLIWLYPRAWRRRYGAELAALVEDSGAGWWDWLNVAGMGLGMRVVGWWPVVAGALIGVGATFWMTPSQVSSMAIGAVGYSYSQEQLDRVSVSDAALAKVIAEEGLFARERHWLPSAVVTFLFRQAITVKARDGYIEATYAGPERNRAMTVRLIGLFTPEGLSKGRPRRMQFIGKPGQRDGEPARPYPVALPVFGELLGLAAGGVGRHLRRPGAGADGLRAMAKGRGRP